MFLIVFATILGGVATALTISPSYGLFAGLLLAPLGGSCLAVVAAGFNAWRTPIYREQAPLGEPAADHSR
jgi:hypothetical protein